MLPARVREAVRGLLRKRVIRLVRAMSDGRIPDASIAENARLVGEAGGMLEPEARRYARVCVWDGECEADATTDDGLCAAHAVEQAREDAEARALAERGEISGEDAG
jgi:hypothetical protein